MKNILPLALAAALSILAAPAATPQFQWPTPTRTVTLSKTIVVPANTTFDGKNTAYKGASNMGDGSQREGQAPLFLLQPGATLKNVIIVHPACDGVHSNGALGRTNRILNCFWRETGEDSITVRGLGKIIIDHCWFQYATDKSIQVNSPSEVIVQDCKVRKFARFARGSGTSGNLAYDITLKRVTAYSGDTLLKLSNSKARGRIEQAKISDVLNLFQVSGGAQVKVVK